MKLITGTLMMWAMLATVVCGQDPIRITGTIEVDLTITFGSDTNPDPDPDPEFELPPGEITVNDRDELQQVIAAIRTEVPDGYTVKLATAGDWNGANYSQGNGIYATDLIAPNASRPYVFTSEDPTNPTALIGWSTAGIFNGCENVVFDSLVSRGGQQNGFSCGDCANVTFSNLRVEAHRQTGNQDPFKMSHSTGVSVIDSVCLDGFGRKGSGIDFVDCHDITVQRCEFDGNGNGESGLQMKQGCTNALIEDCSSTNMRQYGWFIGGTTTGWLDLEPTEDYQVKGVTIRRCVASNSTFLVGLKSCHDVVFEDCDFISPGDALMNIAAESVSDSGIANAQIIGPKNVSFADCSWSYNSATLDQTNAFFKGREEDDLPKVVWSSLQWIDNTFTDIAIEKKYPIDIFDPVVAATVDAWHRKTFFMFPTAPINPTFQ